MQVVHHCGLERQVEDIFAAGVMVMQLGTGNFETYARNLRRIYLADFIDQQMQNQQVELVDSVMVEVTHKACAEKTRNRVELPAPLSSRQI